MLGFSVVMVNHLKQTFQEEYAQLALSLTGVAKRWYYNKKTNIAIKIENKIQLHLKTTGIVMCFDYAVSWFTI